MDRGLLGKHVTAIARAVTVLVSALLTMVLAGCDQPRVVPLGVGDSAPFISTADRVPALIWVFRASSCLGCDLAPTAAEIRLIGHRHADRVAMTAVAVGRVVEENQRLVESFLRRHRILASTVVLDRRGHTHHFGGAPLPAVYVVNRETVVLAIDLTADASDSVWMDLNAKLEALAQAGASRTTCAASRDIAGDVRPAQPTPSSGMGNIERRQACSARRGRWR